MEIKGSEPWKTEAGYASFQGSYKSRQLKRIRTPQEGRVLGEAQPG